MCGQCYREFIVTYMLEIPSSLSPEIHKIPYTQPSPIATQNLPSRFGEEDFSVLKFGLATPVHDLIFFLEEEQPPRAGMGGSQILIWLH